MSISSLQCPVNYSPKNHRSDSSRHITLIQGKKIAGINRVGINSAGRHRFHSISAEATHYFLVLRISRCAAPPKFPCSRAIKTSNADRGRRKRERVKCHYKDRRVRFLGMRVGRLPRLNNNFTVIKIEKYKQRARHAINFRGHYCRENYQLPTPYRSNPSSLYGETVVSIILRLAIAFRAELWEPRHRVNATFQKSK